MWLGCRCWSPPCPAVGALRHLACRPAFSLFFPSFFYSQTLFLLLCFPLALPGDLVATPDRVADGRQGIRASSEPWPWVAPGALLWHGRSPNLPGVWGGSGGFCLLHAQHLALCWPCCPSLVRLLLVAPRSLRWAFFFNFLPVFGAFFCSGTRSCGQVSGFACWKDGAVGGGRRKQLGWRRLSSPSTYRPAAPPSASSGSAS